MDIQQLRDELTKRGISFAPNAGIANLQSKYDEAIAKEAEAENARLAEAAKRAEDEAAAKAAIAAVPGSPAATAPAGNSSSGAEPGAAPAAVVSTAPAEAVPDAIPELEIIEKMRAGLTREQAVEVITNQRAHDKALGH